MSHTLLFLEFPGDGGRFADLLTDPETTVIALMPHVAHELRQLGIPFRYPEHFADWRRQEEAGVSMLDDLLHLCTDGDRMLHELWPTAKERGFEPFRSAFYELLLFRGSIWTKLYRCRAVIDVVAPSQVIYSNLPRPAAEPDPMSFDGRSLYASAVRYLCMSRGIRHSEVVAPLSALDRWKHSPQPNPPTERTATFAERILAQLRPLLPSRRPAGTGPRILMVQRLTASKALQRMAHVEFWDEFRTRMPVNGPDEHSAPSAALLDAWWARLRSDPAFRKSFQLDDTDWFPLAEGGLEHFVKHLVPGAWAILEEADAILDAVKPDATVFGNISTIEVHTVARAVRRRDIPVVTEPHGPFGHFVNYVCTLFDAMASTHYLVPGPGCIEFNRDYGRFSMENVVTGSALIDASRRDRIPRTDGLRALGLDPDRPTVMVVIQAILWNWEYGPYSARDDRRSFDSQLEIIECLAGFPDIQVLLKGHPGVSRPASPVIEIGRKKVGERFAYVASWPFRRMLEMVDCFVMDYAVTTIYEALTTGKRIYALKDFYKVYPPAAQPLQECADFFDDVGSLVGTLRSDLATGSAFRPDNRRTNELMRLYGDPFGDGHSEQRIARAIVEIADMARRTRK
ncbi:MAG TPA: hypothetical protein VKX28_13505 [Xanthobacteraceae bacterium]|nr:hypothetical protein [Xanthobacteraceae bacterium]